MARKARAAAKTAATTMSVEPADTSPVLASVESLDKHNKERHVRALGAKVKQAVSKMFEQYSNLETTYRTIARVTAAYALSIADWEEAKDALGGYLKARITAKVKEERGLSDVMTAEEEASFKVAVKASYDVHRIAILRHTEPLLESLFEGTGEEREEAVETITEALGDESSDVFTAKGTPKVTASKISFVAKNTPKARKAAQAAATATREEEAAKEAKEAGTVTVDTKKVTTIQDLLNPLVNISNALRARFLDEPRPFTKKERSSVETIIGNLAEVTKAEKNAVEEGARKETLLPRSSEPKPKPKAQRTESRKQREARAVAEEKARNANKAS